MHGDWSPEWADALARRAGVGSLGDRHWAVIAATREDTARRGRPPRLERIHELTGLAAGELERLFPGDAECLIMRIAGCDRPPSGGREGPAGDPEEE
jgi:sulfur relay (sulfurtransferase) DsrC/TusE family protein